MAPKVNEAHKEARVNQILKAALTCFSEKGFHKTTMLDICKKSELSAGAVYSYFESKVDIIKEIANYGRQLNDANFASAEEQGITHREMMTAALSTFIDQHKDPFMKICGRSDVMLTAEALSNSEIAEILTVNYKGVLNNVKMMVEDGQKNGSINPKLDPGAIAQILFGVVQSLGIQININPDLDIDTYRETVISMTLDGMMIDNDLQEEGGVK